MLGRPDVLAYLIDRGLVSSAHVVDDGLAILDYSRRHVNFAVTTRRGPQYFLKQARDASGHAALAREAAVYLNLQRFEDRSDTVVPRYHSFDAGPGILVLEFGREGGTLREASLNRRRPSVAGAAAAGRALARFHAATGWADETLLPPSILPWVLGVHRPSLRILEEFSAVNIELIRIIQSHPHFGEHLDELAAGFENSALVHGDARWDNCLLATPVRGRSAEVRLVDLELAGQGDPAWDVGCFLGEYLGSWVLSVPVAGNAVDARLLETATHPLEPMQPAIRSFWRSYARTAGRIDEDPFLQRAVAYAGSRLIQTAFEHTHESSRMTSQAVCLLQLSLNVMDRPAEAAIHLLGIRAA